MRSSTSGTRTSCGRAGAEDGPVQAHELGQVGGDAVEVVRGEHDGQPVVVQVAEQVEDLVAGADVDARRRLVEQQQVGFGEQGAGEEHPLLLSTRQRTDVAAGELADAELVEHPPHVGLLLLGRPGQEPAADPGHEHALGHRDREVPVDPLDLGHVGDADDRGAARPCRRPGPPHRTARAAGWTCPNPTARRCRGSSPRVDVQVDVVEHGRPVVGGRRPRRGRADGCGSVRLIAGTPTSPADASAGLEGARARRRRRRAPRRWSRSRTA